MPDGWGLWEEWGVHCSLHVQSSHDQLIFFPYSLPHCASDPTAPGQHAAGGSGRVRATESESSGGLHHPVLRVPDRGHTPLPAAGVPRGPAQVVLPGGSREQAVRISLQRHTGGGRELPRRHQQHPVVRGSPQPLQA